MSTKSKYVLQVAERTRCPKCGERPQLLAREDGMEPGMWFYICFKCERVAQVSVGVVATVDLNDQIVKKA